MRSPCPPAVDAASPAAADRPGPTTARVVAARPRLVATPLLWRALLVGGCSESPAERKADAAKAAPTVLTLSGSSTMQPLITDIARRFEASHPGTRVEVEGGGSGRGVSDSRGGKSDIGMVSRALGDDEKDLQGFAIARDGIAVLVHRDNPVAALKQQQLVDIFTGKTTHWKAVGGKDAAIHAITRDEGRSSLEVFTRYLGIKAAEIKAPQSLGDNALVFEALASNPNAIAFVSVGESETRAASLPIKLLTVDGVAASSKTVSSGNYPIARPLSLVTRGQPTGVAKEFIDFALSPQVADIVRKHDFVAYLE